MDKWVGWVAEQNEEGAENARTEEQWSLLKTDEQWDKWFENNSKSKSLNKDKELARLKENYLKYGSIYGKKYAVKTNYGQWDSEFTLEKLKAFVNHFHRVLRVGGSCIIFFDLWKLTDLKNILEEAGFKQFRFIEWIKTT
jgi:site-specific DNA-methyltransferase (adenine-specific)